MNLRKEQVLFLAALALGVLVWKGRSDEKPVTIAHPKSKDWEGLPPAPVVLADADGAGAAAGKDLFREPTEAEPLPPRQLDYPPLAALPIVAPPLHPGQTAMAFDQLRMDGGEPEAHAFPDAGGAGTPGTDGGAGTGTGNGEGAGAAATGDGDTIPDPVAAGTGATAQQPQSGIPEEVLKQEFDQLYGPSQRTPFYGHILSPDKVALATAPALTAPVKFEMVSAKTGKPYTTKDFKPEEIARLVLADNLENRIALRKLELSDAQASIPRRIDFIRDLLVEARTQPSAYAEAEAQARKIAELSPPGSELGYRWTARVLRAQGDLGKEWAFYQSLPQPIAESSFRYRAQGDLEARLALWADAEAHLRKAAEISPNDARSLAGLARYLLDQGRPAEAEPFAERASRNANTVVETEDRFDVLRVPVDVHLALGELDAALEALDRTSGLGSDEERTYLAGAVRYARGELDEAADMFERSAAHATDLEPVLGLGVIALRRGKWDEARDALQRVADGSPLLRGRALAALGLLVRAHRAPERVDAESEGRRTRRPDRPVHALPARPRAAAEG